MFNVAWEKSFESVNAEFEPIKKVTPFASSLRKIARMKMIDVSSISAEFEDEYVFFEPKFYTLIKLDSATQFIGVYKSDEKIKGVPSYCIRQVNWSFKEDYSSLQINRNWHDHISGDQQLVSNVSFLGKAPSERLDFLADRLTRIVSKGIFLDSLERENLNFEDIELSFFGDFFECKISYEPREKYFQELENLLFDLLNFSKSLSDSECIRPDNNFRLSYRSSLSDYINFDGENE